MYLCNRKQNTRKYWSDPLFLLLLWFSYTWCLISCWMISVDLWELFCCHIIFTFPLLTLLDRNKQLHVLKQSYDQHPSQKVLRYRISLHLCWVSLQSSFCELSTLISWLLWRLKSCLLFMLSKIFFACAICKIVLLPLATLEDNHCCFGVCCCYAILCKNKLSNDLLNYF